MNSIKITRVPTSNLIFQGIGAEADCFIFDEVNASCGIGQSDLELIERRMKAISPAIARLFVYVDSFNPSLDGGTLVWDQPGYLNLLRQLRLLEEIGTRVNLVMFSPFPTEVKDVSLLVRAMIGLIERLRADEGLTCISWLTLYNEPDGIYLHDSPLMRRIFPDRFETHPRFEEYVTLNREAHRLLIERGLYPSVKLIVADTVWGHPVRVERMTLCTEAFRDLDVVYGYHNYSLEDPKHYNDKPDFTYIGMVEETKLFREMVGPSADLMLWEFNVAGPGFGTFYPGVGPHGEDSIGRVETGVELAWRILSAAANGVNGFSVWCMHDMVYPGCLPGAGQMTFGLWRFKWQGWHPRPYYHYFALLAKHLRPGARVVGSEVAAPGVTALATENDGKITLVIANMTNSPIELTLEGLEASGLRRSRVYPELIPEMGDLPVSKESTTGTAVELLPLELTAITEQ